MFEHYSRAMYSSARMSMPGSRKGLNPTRKASYLSPDSWKVRTTVAEVTPTKLWNLQTRMWFVPPGHRPVLEERYQQRHSRIQTSLFGVEYLNVSFSLIVSDN